MMSVLGAGFIIGMIPAGILPANILNIERAYNLSHADMGRIVGFSLICGGAFGGLVGGWMCGRMGALRTLLLSLIVAVAALLSISLIDNVYAIIIGLTAYFLAAALMGSSNALAASMLPDGQRGVNLLHGVNAVGKLSGPILATLFLYGAWRYSFLTVAVLVMLLAIPVLMAGGNGHESIGRRRKEDGSPGYRFWVLVSGFALIAGSELCVVLWMPTYSQEIRNFSASQSNMLLAIFLLGLVAGRFAASALSPRISSIQAIGICGSTVLFAAPVLYFSTFALVSVFLLLFGLAYSATWPSYFAHLSRLYPNHLGALTGGAVFWNHAGFAGAACVSGRLAELHLAYPIAFGAIVMGAFALVFCLSSTGKHVKVRKDNNPGLPGH